MPNSPQLDWPLARAGESGLLAPSPTVPPAHTASTLGTPAFPTAPRLMLLAVGAFSLAGVAFALWLRGVPAGTPDPRLWYNIFFVVFARNEPIGLAVVALFCFAAAVFIFGKHLPPAVSASATRRRHIPVTLIAFATFVIAASGTHLVSHNYGLSADENMADFQAKIFLRGKITADVPAQWVPAVRVVKPTFVEYFPATQSWKSAYLPVYAAMRALLQSAHLQSLLNPLLAAAAVLALFGAARNIWPGKQNHPWLAAALLGASSQFLLMATTAYSMPAHLTLNAIWMWLYSKPERRRFYLAPVVGVLAIGLHQPNVHALFAAPFLFRLVLQRKWRASAIFGAIYIVGGAGWLVWRSHYSANPNVNTTEFFRLFNPRMLIIQPMDLLLLIAWSSLATPLLFLLGLHRIRRAPSIVQDAALSCALTFGFYYFFYLDQGHGWGYRYFHGTLGCLVLVAVAGWENLVTIAGVQRAQRFVVAAVACSLLVQLPLRCLQVEAFVRPYARASQALHSLEADIVGVNPFDAPYAADLIRNDPFLEHRPIIVGLIPLTRHEVETLENAGKTHFITRDEMAAFGLATERRDDLRHDPFWLGRGP